MTGRITPLALIQLLQVLASSLSINFPSAYPLVLAVLFVVFVTGSTVAVRTAWCVCGSRLFALTATFVAGVIAVAPSPHELLYWLPGPACYVPPATVVIIFLGLLTRLEPLSPLQVTGLASAGLIVAICNEFTAVWLSSILVFSIVARQLTGMPREWTAHGVVTAAVLAGFAVTVAAPGNAARLDAIPGTSGARRSMASFMRFRVWVGSSQNHRCWLPSRSRSLLP
ncbi:hypothetical protein [Bradyrhizobium sp. LMG 9283]|uniref:hypothetical protein n=1 Tax=Bradyrhizobium sp. LMG 9283 TaxID=592064 RepID=UPI00388E967B